MILPVRGAISSATEYSFILSIEVLHTVRVNTCNDLIILKKSINKNVLRFIINDQIIKKLLKY